MTKIIPDQLLVASVLMKCNNFFAKRTIIDRAYTVNDYFRFYTNYIVKKVSY